MALRSCTARAPRAIDPVVLEEGAERPLAAPAGGGFNVVPRPIERGTVSTGTPAASCLWSASEQSSPRQRAFVGGLLLGGCLLSGARCITIVWSSPTCIGRPQQRHQNGRVAAVELICVSGRFWSVGCTAARPLHRCIWCQPGVALVPAHIAPERRVRFSACVSANNVN